MMFPLWARVVVPVLILAAAFAAGWKVAAWRYSGQVAKAKAEATAAVEDRDEAIAFRKGCIEDLATIRERAQANEAAMREAEARYAEAVARPPRVVVEYRDRWHTVTDTVVSEDCAAGLGELFDWIHTLPAYREEVPDAGP